MDMQTYYGTKKVKAETHSRTLSGDEGKIQDGYTVAYEDGYISFSPKEVFEKAYRANGFLSFGHALFALKEGKKLARSGWNGKGMFIILVPGTPEAKLNEGTPYQTALQSNIVTINPHIDMYTATGEFQPGWLASQTDLLAEDWTIID